MSTYTDRIMELETFRAHLRAARPEAAEWCWRILRGGHTLAATASLDERAGWLLAALAPSRWRFPQLDDDDFTDDDLDDEG